MPDDIIISELTNAPQIDDSAVFPLTQDNGGSPATFKGTMSQVAGKVAEGTTYVNLETTAKTLVGAINEVNQGGGGGSADIISEASGSIATFTDGGDNIPVKSLVTDIVAVQAGSGTPSPSNVRPITGFDSVVITNKDDIDTPTTTDTHTITLPETIYGGSLDVTQGSGVKTHGYIASYNGETINEPWISSIDEYVPNTNPSTGAQVVYPLATPTTITTTPEPIPTLSGNNNIYSNTGDVEIEYFNENADQLAELIKAMTR